MDLAAIQRTNLVILSSLQSICIKSPVVAGTIFGLSEKVIQLFSSATREDLACIARNSTSLLGSMRAADNPVIWSQIFDDLRHDSREQSAHVSMVISQALARQ